MKLDELVTTRYSLDDTTQGFADMNAGRNLRGVVVYDRSQQVEGPIMNVLIEMTALCLTRPAPGADAQALAAWYAAKARLHDHLAGLGGPDSARERELAAAAHRRAVVVAGDPA